MYSILVILYHWAESYKPAKATASQTGTKKKKKKAKNETANHPVDKQGNFYEYFSHLTVTSDNG